MVVELFEGDQGKPVISVTGEVLTIRDRSGLSSVTTVEPARYRLKVARRRELSALRDDALAILDSVVAPQTLVEHRDAVQRGPRNRLVLQARGVTREIEWSYPDRVPDAVESLFRGLQATSWDVPREHFQRNVVKLVRDAAEARTGVPAASWTLVEKTREVFDHHRSLPDADYSGAMTLEGVDGYRVSLRHGDTSVAYHAVAAQEVLFAETWQRGEFPRYAPAALDLAHRAREAGHLTRALAALDSVVATARWSEKLQAELEIAEIRGQRGQFDRAEQLFRRHLGSGSQEAHTLASCGVAWVGVMRRVKTGEVPPPSQWQELHLHPWWRAGMPQVSGVPGRHASLQAALDNGPASHRAAVEARRAQRGVG